MLTEILSSAENLLSAKYVCMFFLALSLYLIFFSFCLSRAFYVHVVQGVCSWCAHVCSWFAHVYGECSCMFRIAFACWLKYCLVAVEKMFFSRVCLYVFFCFTVGFICFSFCLSRVLYVNVGQGVCSWCAHVHGECSFMFHIAFACWLKYCLVAVEKMIFSRVCLYVFFCFTVGFICFSFCLSRVLYVNVVQGVCSWCAHVHGECSCMFYIVFVMLAEILSSAEN